MKSLFILAYRTLLFRISQLRGVEMAGAQGLKEQSDADNRFAVNMVLSVLGKNIRFKSFGVVDIDSTTAGLGLSR